MTSNDQDAADARCQPQAARAHVNADALPHLTILARLPPLPERGPDLLPRINSVLGMVDLLNAVDVRHERPSSMFDPRWVDHASL